MENKVRGMMGRSSDGMPSAIILLLTAIAAFTSFLFRAAVCKEFCQFEIFVASCPNNQVILMQEATYGRLELGRCVTRDYGFLGCSQDVLHLLDRSCSGQRACQFGVPKLRDLVQPCPRDLTAYLDATYRCLTVVDYSSLRCNSTISISSASTSSSISSSSSFFFSTFPSSSSLFSSSSTGSYAVGLSSADSVSVGLPSSVHSSSPLTSEEECRLHFSVDRGQRIRLTVYNIGQLRSYEEQEEEEAPSSDEGHSVTDASSSHDGLRPSCMPGHGRSPLDRAPDGGVDDARRNCGLRRREQPLMTTNGTQATLLLSNGMRAIVDRGRRWNHILQFEVVGCADVRSVSVDSWIERFDDRLVIHCNRTKETLYLTCKGTQWIGLLTNCSNDFLRKGEIDASRKTSFPLGIMAATAIGILLGIVLGILLLFLLVHRRRSKNRLTKNLKSTVLLGNDEADYLDVDESLAEPPTPFQKRWSDRHVVPMDTPTLDWLHLLPSTPINAQVGGVTPPQLVEMRCQSTMDDNDFEATFVARCLSANVPAVEDDSQSYAVCLRRKCGSHAHPCLSPTSHSREECGCLVQMPCVNYAHSGLYSLPCEASQACDNISTTTSGSHAHSGCSPTLRGSHAQSRLATTHFIHAQVPPQKPKSKFRHAYSCSSHAHYGIHAHSGAVSPIVTSRSHVLQPGFCGNHAHMPLIPRPHAPEAHLLQHEASHEKLKSEALPLLSTDLVVMVGATGNGCPDLVQNNSLS